MQPGIETEFVNKCSSSVIAYMQAEFAFVSDNFRENFSPDLLPHVGRRGYTSAAGVYYHVEFGVNC